MNIYDGRDNRRLPIVFLSDMDDLRFGMTFADG